MNSDIQLSELLRHDSGLGPAPKPSYTKDFLDLAVRQNPKPQTVAIVAADAEFGLYASEGARENAKAAGLSVVYDRRYPSATTDLAPVVRAIAETKPDLVIVCSYPPDLVGMVRAVNEVGFRPKMIGGAMVGLQSTAIKTRSVRCSTAGPITTTGCRFRRCGSRAWTT